MVEYVKGTSFSFSLDDVQPRLIISVEGPEFCGKTHFALTAPAPIFYMATDFGHEGVVQQFQKKKKIAKAVYEFDAPGTSKKKKWQDYAKEGEELRNTVWKQFVADYDYAIHNARTIVWDTATEIWELLRLCHFGKLHQNPQMMYGPVNAEFKDLIRKAVQSRANLILLHQQDEMREDRMDPRDGQMKSYVLPGQFKRKGFKHMGYLVQAYCTSHRVDPKIDKKTREVTQEIRFEIEVYKSRHNKDAVGMRFGNPDAYPYEAKSDFPTVAGYLSPDVPEEEWRTKKKVV